MKFWIAPLFFAACAAEFGECQKKLTIPKNEKEQIPELKLELNSLAGSAIGLCHYFIESGKFGRFLVFYVKILILLINFLTVFANFGNSLILF